MHTQSNIRLALVFSMLYLFSFCTTTEKESVDDAVTKVLNIESPAGLNASLPHLTNGGNSSLYLSWVETVDGTPVFKYAVLKDKMWTEGNEIAQGTDLFTNWADYPMIEVNKSGGVLANYMVVTSEEKFSNDIHMLGKTASGSWSKPGIPHTDRSLVQHGFVAMIPDANDQFHLAWLDGRNGGSEGEEHYGEMTLQAVVANLEGHASEERVLDDYVCSCCQIGGTMTENGPIVVYRDRSKKEVRDISIVRLVNGSWTEPQSVHKDGWTIAGCPVNGPRADAIGNNLAVAWFTAAENNPQVKVIFSPDGGETFNDAITIDNKRPLGRVDLVMLDSSRAMVSWMCKQGDQTLIKAQVVHASGQVEPATTIAHTDAARASGFPQMAKLGNQVYFAWTHLLGEERTEVRISSIEVSGS